MAKWSGIFAEGRQEGDISSPIFTINEVINKVTD